MSRRSPRAEDPLKALGRLANVLDTPVYLDDTTTNQRRGLREAADSIRTALEEYTDLTPPVLMAFWTGAMAQAHITSLANPMPQILAKLAGGAATDAAPHIALNIAVAYLARDMLAGRRVE